MEGSRSSSEKTRRKFVKMSGIGAGTLLAGCFGDGGSGGDQTETIVDDQTDSDVRFDNITIEFWDGFGTNVGRNEWVRQITREFERNTGATVKLNLEGIGNAYNSWPQSIEQGTRPHIHSYMPAFGPAIKPKYWYTYDNLRKDYSNELDDDTVGDTEWLSDMLKYAARGVPDTDIAHTPVFLSPRSPVLSRYDFIEEAGLENSYPPSSFEEAIEFSRTLQNNSGAEFGFQFPGSPGDYLGFLHSQVPEMGGPKESSFFNEDVSDIQIDNDAFKGAVERMKTMMEEGVVAPDTPSLSGPDVTGQMATTSRYGATVAEPKHHTNIVDTNPSALSEEKIKWYPMWGDDQRASMAAWTYNIVPVDESDNKQKRRQDAAVHFLANYWISEGFHEQMGEKSGFFPSKKDTWQAAKENVQHEEKHQWMNSLITMAENTQTMGIGYGNMEKGGFVPIESAGGEYVTQYLLDELSLDEAMNRWANDARNALGMN